MNQINKDSLAHLGIDFQYRLILQILTDHRFALSILEILDPNFFEENTLKVIVAKIKDAYQEDDCIPDTGTLLARLLEESKTEVDQKFIIAQIRKIEEASLNDTIWVQKTGNKFCKRQELKKALKKMAKIVENGSLDDYDQCEDIMKKALEYGNNDDDIGCDVFDDVDKVLSEDYRDPIPTGIFGLDEYMDGGLSKGELAIILAAFGVGKAQPLTSKILTPNGWKTMGDVKIGDEVIGKDGNSTKVLGVYPQGSRPIYSVKFNDKTETLCDEEHLWAVNTINQRNRSTKVNGKSVTLPSDDSYKIMKTKDMINNVKVWNNRRLNYRIPNVDPVNFTKKELSIDPYLLGVMLGDGCMTKSNEPNFTTKDVEIINEIRKVHSNIKVSTLTKKIEVDNGDEMILVKRTLEKVSVLGIKDKLIELGLFGCNSATKFIPSEYLLSTVEDRISILQGLIDTDGYIDGHRIEIISKSKQLSEGITEIVRSLGGKISIKEKETSYNKGGVITYCGIGYRMSISFPNNGVIPARLSRKVNKFNPRTKYSNNKFINSIEYVGEMEAQCIMVENPEHLYVTDDYIVTHNTTALTKIANSAKNIGKNVLQIFFEDNPKVIKRKHYACWSGIDLNELGIRRDEVKQIVHEEQSKPGELRLAKFASHGTSITTIKTYIRRLIAQGFTPDVVIVDYIDCIRPTTAASDQWEGEGVVMREFESMLSEYNMAGWTAVQGNRSSINSEIVQADQIGGSIKKGQIGHFIVSVSKTLEQKENGTANIAILKSRFGRDGIIFEDIVFDNAKIRIDVTDKSSGRSFFKQEGVRVERNQDRIKDLFEAVKAKKNAINADNNDDDDL